MGLNRAVEMLLIDTSVIVRLEREGPSEDFNPVFDDSQVAISAITASELLLGVLRSPPERRTARGAVVDRLLAGFRCIPIDSTVARAHSRMTADLRSRGEGIGIHDEWIAATALVHGATVVTLNRNDFERVPGLKVASPGD